MNFVDPVVTSNEVFLFLNTLYPDRIRKDNKEHCFYLRKSSTISALSNNLTKSESKPGKIETRETFAHKDFSLDSKTKEAIARGDVEAISSLLLPRANSNWHLVINGTGQGTESKLINKAWVIQFESDDDRTPNDKMKDWERLKMPQPTMQVFTGSKSVHSYWVLDQAYDANAVFELQVQLLRQGKYLGADGWNWKDSYINAFKVKTMRVPGFKHHKTGVEARIINAVQKNFYTADKIADHLSNNLLGEWDEKLQWFNAFKPVEQRKQEHEAFLAEQERVRQEKAQKAAEYRKQQEALKGSLASKHSSLGIGSGIPTGARIDLIQFASKNARELFNIGTVKDKKFTDCGIVGNELIGLQNWADDFGIEYERSAVELFMDFCHRSNIPDYECRNRFNSLNKKNPRPSAEAYITEKILGIKSNSVDDDFNKKNAEQERQEAKERLKQAHEIVKEIKVRVTDSEYDDDHLGWDALKLIFAYEDLLKKIKHEPDKQEIIDKWKTEIPGKDFRTSNGLIFTGKIADIKNSIANGKISISDDVEDFKGDKAIAIIVARNLVLNKEDVKKLGKKFDFIIEDYKKCAKVFSWLCSTNLAHRAYVNDDGNIWGAGYFYAMRDELIKPDIELNQKYLEFEAPVNSRIVAIKSEMGTGKTQWMANLLKLLQSCGVRCLAVYSRVLLCSSISERLVLELYNDLLKSQQERLYNFQLLGGAMCINSLKSKGFLPFDPSKWGGVANTDIIFLDEIESTMETLASGSTIKHNRSEIENTFIELIRNVLNPRGRGIVILSDANLKESTIQLIQKIAGWDLEKDGDLNNFTCRVVNNWKYEEERKAYIYDDPQTFVGAMAQAVNQEQRMYIATDTREPKSEQGCLTSEALAEGIKLLGRDTIRVDQDTQHATDHPDYGVAADAKVLVRELKRRNAHLIASPTLNCGISFDKYPDNLDISSDFTSVWGALKGVVSLNDGQQMLERERSNVDRHLFISKIGKPNGASTYTTETALAQEEALKNTLTLEGIKGALKQIYNPQQVEAIVSANIGFEDKWIAAWRRKTLMMNAWGGIQYAVNFKAHLRQRGYKLIEVESCEQMKGSIPIPALENTEENKAKLEEVLTQIKTSLEEVSNVVQTQQEKVFAKYAAESMSLFQGVAVKCCQERMQAIVSADETIVTEELIKKSDRKMLEHHAVTKHYYNIWARGVACTLETLDIWFNHRDAVENGFIVFCMMNGYEAADAKAFKDDARNIISGGKQIKDCNSTTLKKNLLRKVSADKFIDWTKEVGTYSIKNREVAEFNKVLVDNRFELKAAFGIQISIAEDKATTNIGNFLRLLGWNHKSVKQACENGIRIRYYEIVMPPAIYFEFWTEWASKGGMIILESEIEQQIYGQQINVVKKTISDIPASEDLFEDFLGHYKGLGIAI